MIGNIRRTNEILNKYNIRAKKNFGQNFLIDENVLKKIVSVANLNKEDGVIEIGPGIGALTEVLLQNAKKVLAYEIDNNLINVLNQELKDFNNLKVINKDFLKANIKEDLQYFEDCHRVLVISNLPYYITTPIIFKLLEEETQIMDFYFMVQKEVGMRLTSKPNTKDYNSLSVLIAYKAQAKICFNVSKNCFLPSPDVESVIIHISKKKDDLNVKNEQEFIKFIQSIFIQRRKTLVNNITSSYHLSKEKVTTVLKNLGYDPAVRSEALNLYQIKDIYTAIIESPI